MSTIGKVHRFLAVTATAALIFNATQTVAQTPNANLAPGAKTSGPNPDSWPGKKKLLFIADVQTGYHHDAINHTMAVVEKIGRESGAYVTFLRTDSELLTKNKIEPQGKYVGGNINVKGLNFFDAIFLLPSGYGTMSDEQKAALISFVREDGKGLIVGHAAGAAFIKKDGKLTWPEWGFLIGGMMDRRPDHNAEFRAVSKVIVEDAKFPGAMSWGKTSFMLDEQHPLLMPPYYSRDKVHVIMRLDPASVPEQYRKQHPDGDFPVVWAQQYGKGRVFSVGWGEFETTWDDPGMQKMMLGAIKWALGSTPADVTPKPLPKALSSSK